VKNQDIAKAILLSVRQNPGDLVPYNDALGVAREWVKEDFDSAHKFIHMLHNPIDHAIAAAVERKDYDVLPALDQLKFGLLLFGAQDFFDDYLQAVEYGKPLWKQFYLPRRHYLRRYVDAYQEIIDGKLDFLSISMPKRSGKAVTLDTPIPTPYGFKRMGDIRVGDLVMARDGYDTTVTGVFPQGKVPVYEVRFTDGATVKTCAEHLWKVRFHNVNSPSGKCGYSERVMSTGDIMKHGLRGGKGRSEHNLFSVEYCEPAEFLYQEVLIDPYVLGVLLGDGGLTESTVNITTPDAEIIEYISTHLPEGDICERYQKKKDCWRIHSETRKYDSGGHLVKCATAEALEHYGLLGKRSYEKHIPDDYVFTTSEMRLELLRGLLDTDGYAQSKGIEFSTTSPQLRDAVMFIVRSLGGYASCKVRMGSYTKNGAHIQTRENYRINICFPSSINPFKLSRKANAYKPKREKLYRYIESITPCGEEEAQCICVDNDEHLYLVGTYFVPTHNSQLGINFINMMSGRRPDRAILAEGTGDDLVRSFYTGCLEYLLIPSEYHYYDIFPDVYISQTNADLKTINFNEKSRFPTIMCRSIDSRQVGLSEATNLLYLDDCVEGREEAKDRSRLDRKWEVISGDILGRAIEGTPIVICGTRYSLYDPIGRLQEEMAKQGKRTKILETPALDPETDETNFEYVREGQHVFTTQYFRDQRDMLTEEQWMSEFQQQPFEARGILFPKHRLNYFYELPVDREPDAIVAYADTAEKGEDYCALVVGYIYGDDVYIPYVVYDDSPPEATKPECAHALIDNHVVSACFECNAAGEYFARDVLTIMENHGYSCDVRTKRSLANKQTRIEFASDNIIKHFYFLHPSKYPKASQYAFFVKAVQTYTRSGKVPHDDAPDALAGLENYIRGRLTGNAIEIIDRPF